MAFPEGIVIVDSVRVGEENHRHLFNPPSSSGSFSSERLEFLKLGCANAQALLYSVPSIWNTELLRSTLCADFGGRMRFGVVLKSNWFSFTHLFLFA